MPDEDFIRPIPMDITENIPAPQLTLSQVYYALLKTKQTSTGQDNIPFSGLEGERCHTGTCSASNLEPILVNSKVAQCMEAS